MALLVWLLKSSKHYIFNHLFQKHILKQQRPHHKLLLYENTPTPAKKCVGICWYWIKVTFLRPHIVHAYVCVLRKTQKCQFYFTSRWLISQQYFCASNHSCPSAHHEQESGGIAPLDGDKWSVSLQLLYPKGRSLLYTEQNAAQALEPVLVLLFLNFFFKFYPYWDLIASFLGCPGQSLGTIPTELSHITSQWLQTLPDSRIHICGRRECGIPARTMERNFSVRGNRTSTLSHVKSQTSLLWLNSKCATHWSLKTINRINNN